MAGAALVLLLMLLYTCTFITDINPSLFFGFAIANGVLQSCINSYLQTAIVAIASWFGPSAIRSMFSGQAAVAVIISALQLLSAIESLRRLDSVSWVSSSDSFKGRSSVDSAASTFFLVMTAGMIIAVISHAHLTHMSIYKEASLEFEGKPGITEETPLLHDQQAGSTTHAGPESSPAHRILQVS
jgi:equilibrative nucleoside transporter 1/2/3